MNTVIKRDNSDSDNDNLIAARSLYDNGEYKQALGLFLDLVSVKILDTSVYIDIGNSYYYLEDEKNALEFWQRAVDLAPEKPIAYINIGNLYYKKRQIDKAISYWVLASTIKPEDSQVNINLAVAFNKKEMRELSINFYEKFLKYEKDKESEDYITIKEYIEKIVEQANEYLEAGVKLQENQEPQAALKAYFKALAYYPGLAKANLNLGSLFYSNNNLPLAIKYWKNSFYIDSKNQNVVLNLALAYDKSKEFDYAFCYYKRFSDFVSGNKEEFDKVGVRMAGLKKILNVSPHLKEKHLESAKEYLSVSDYRRALEEFRNYIILMPNEKDKYLPLINKIKLYINPESQIIANCFKEGDALYAKKEFAEAKNHYERILELSSPKYLEYNKAKAKLASCLRYI